MGRWNPDTCGCVFDFEPDPNDGSNQIFVAVVNTCSEHSGLSGAALHQKVLKDENQVKNKIHGYLLDLDEMAEDVVTDSGNIVRRFKKGNDMIWSFTGKDDTRVLSIDTKGYTLNPAQKISLDSFAKNNLSADKVQII